MPRPARATDRSAAAGASGGTIRARGAAAGQPAIHHARDTRLSPFGQSPQRDTSGRLDDQEVSAILGKSVRSSAGEDMGRIVDVIVSHDGEIRAAIIDFGGFLGIGTRKIAVDWRALNFAPAGKPGTISLELTRNQVRLAPEYKRGEPVVVVGAAGTPRAVPSSEAAAPER